VALAVFAAAGDAGYVLAEGLADRRVGFVELILGHLLVLLTFGS
jgi:hypothetical protein